MEQNKYHLAALKIINFVVPNSIDCSGNLCTQRRDVQKLLWGFPKIILRNDSLLQSFYGMKMKRLLSKSVLGFHFASIFLGVMVSGVACGKDKDNNDTLVGTMLVALNANTSCANKDHCKMFVSNSYAVLNARIEGLDSQCASDINKPSSSTSTYKALVADGTNRIACTSANCATGSTSEQIDWVLKPNKEYRRADGTTVIGNTSVNGIFESDLTNEVSSVITGTNFTITGLNANWTNSPNDCSNFSASAGNVSFGSHIEKTIASVIAFGNTVCSSSRKLYCVEQ
ncbi:DUF1554 domain-containing protein [Leptospira terpstrae]|uniref:DUF1554 domain-containing protein n=1 Tax=Leptospira terpstrae TaxID=293075 RepID=UPI003D046DCC